MSEDRARFAGFDNPVAKSVLADFLLTHCLENQRHESGRRKPLARAFPTHYHAAWIDLPTSVSDLRLVPESVVTILVDQAVGETIVSDATAKSLFCVNDDFTANVLLSIFGRGMSTRERQRDLVDEFDESVNLGLDQLATIRMARQCQQPIKLRVSRAANSKRIVEGRGSSEIANQHPIAKRAARCFRDDMGLFLQAYGKSIPRQSLTQMLESCIGLGLTNLIFSTAASLIEWENTGQLPTTDRPWPMIVDCSSGSDHALRRLSEEGVDDAIRRIQRLPTVLMALRILEWHARHELRGLPPKRPDATARINLLGDILFERQEDSRQICRDVRKSCITLSERLAAEEVGSAAQNILDDESAISSPIWRLAEAVVQMMGERQQLRKVIQCINSCLMVGQSNGLAFERRVQFQTMRNGKKSGMIKSIVLTDTMLEFLVHRHLRQPDKDGQTQPHSLSFNDFVLLLRERYGLFIDQAPTGQAVSRELLQRNRQFLERRLRSLGLLMGVNDAESMKRLRPRFEATGGIPKQGDADNAHDD